MNPIQTAPPENSGLLVSITSDTQGSYSIEDIKEGQPILWYGPYQTGKLAVYECAVVGEPFKPLRAIVYVYTDTLQEEYQHVGFVVFDATETVEDAICNLLDTLNNSYIAETMREKSDALESGSKLQ